MLKFNSYIFKWLNDPINWSKQNKGLSTICRLSKGLFTSKTKIKGEFNYFFDSKMK